ncbi:response regulator [Variovorax boronicumulans]
MTKRVLLVEDDSPKRNQIVAVLQSISCEISYAHSVNGAIRRLDDQAFDCILLDMSLPTFNEGDLASSSGRQQDIGGRQILTYIWELEIDAKVLLVTQLPGFKTEKGNNVKLKDLHEELKESFPELYGGFVYFNHTTDAWAKRIIEFVQGA